MRWPSWPGKKHEARITFLESHGHPCCVECGVLLNLNHPNIKVIKVTSGRVVYACRFCASAARKRVARAKGRIRA